MKNKYTPIHPLRPDIHNRNYQTRLVKANPLASRIQFFDEIASRWETELGERESAIVAEAIEFLPPATGQTTLLDAGCGTGVLLPFLRDYKVIAVDIAPEMLRIARERSTHPNVSFIHAGCESLPLNDASVDAVVGLNVYPHLNDVEKGLREVKRVLKADGRVILFHFQNSKAVTEIHRSIGGAVANDILPPAENVATLMSRLGFKMLRVKDNDYFLIAAMSQSERSSAMVPQFSTSSR